MNKVDFDNVKTEITLRGLEFKEGGTFTEDYIKGLSTDELKKLADNYKNNEKNDLINQIKLSAKRCLRSTVQKKTTSFCLMVQMVTIMAQQVKWKFLRKWTKIVIGV